LTGSLPYGFFIRRFHYLSGQCFVIFTLAHTLDRFLRAGYRRITLWEWISPVFSLILGFALLFTGFILKGDKEGILAARVMVHLAREIPLIGNILSRTLLRPGEDFFLLPYLHHAVIIPMFSLLLLVQHRKRVFPRGELDWVLLAIFTSIALFYPLPPDIPPHVDAPNITGPWFFHGIQMLLRYGPPFWMGVFWALLPFGLLALLPFAPESITPWAKWLVALIWILNGALIVMAQWF
jgi:hypothetical protein